MNQTILRCFFVISNVWFVENMYTLFNFPKNWSFPEKHCFPSNRGNYVLFCDIIFSGAPF